MAAKPDVNPMHASPRCSARSKRTGLPCGAPAVTGWTVCRMHGAGGGAPSGERHGRYRHGMRTSAHQAERKALQRILADMRATMESCIP